MRYSNAKEAEEVLKRNHTVTVGSHSVTIGSVKPGIKQWGAIDFLVRVHKYVLIQGGVRV